MNILNKLERRFGKYAVPNLMYYIVILYAIGVMVQMLAPEVYFRYLMLDARAVLHGQIWRVVTFMIWPPSGDMFFNLLAIYLYYNLGTTLERVWGSFRFNVYFLMGVLGHVLAAVAVYLMTGSIYLLTTSYLNFSLFFAFAATFPDMQFFLFFVIPIKAKWLALFDGAYFAYAFVFGTAATRVAVVMSLLNFIVYFVMSRGSRYHPKEFKRRHDFKAQARQTAQAVKEQAVTGAQSAEGRIWMIQIWYSGIVQNVRGIMNIVRTISIRISISRAGEWIQDRRTEIDKGESLLWKRSHL